MPDNTVFSFKNIGNSCYLNAGIQCLMRLPALNAALDNVDAPNGDAGSAQHFFKEYNDLRRMALDNENCTISPALFRHAVQLYAKQKKNEDFSGLQQNDACEFIQFMLHGIHDALARQEDFDSIPVETETEKKCVAMMKATFGKEFSDIVHLCYGLQLSCIKDNMTPEAFMTLNLSIPPEATSLEHCLRAYTADETIEGWVDETTKQTETVVRSLRFFRLPAILFLCLKRFSSDGRKNSQAIDVPVELTIGECAYHLQCGCIHEGGPNSGHFNAFANIKGNWTVIDDDTYYPVGPKMSNNVYCVFYVQQ